MRPAPGPNGSPPLSGVLAHAHRSHSAHAGKARSERTLRSTHTKKGRAHTSSPLRCRAASASRFVCDIRPAKPTTQTEGQHISPRPRTRKLKNGSESSPRSLPDVHCSNFSPPQRQRIENDSSDTWPPLSAASFGDRKRQGDRHGYDSPGSIAGCSVQRGMLPLEHPCCHQPLSHEAAAYTIQAHFAGWHARRARQQIRTAKAGAQRSSIPPLLALATTYAGMCSPYSALCGGLSIWRKVCSAQRLALNARRHRAGLPPKIPGRKEGSCTSHVVTGGTVPLHSFG